MIDSQSNTALHKLTKSLKSLWQLFVEGIVQARKPQVTERATWSVPGTIKHSLTPLASKITAITPLITNILPS